VQRNRSSGLTVLGVAIVGLVVLAAAIGSVLLLAQHCDRQVGDETDFPVFNLIARAACGASALR
jgi:hypothetical protein